MSSNTLESGGAQGTDLSDSITLSRRSWATGRGEAIRRVLVQKIQAEPGLHKSALARDLGTSWGTTGHHLDRLEQAHAVRAVRKGGRVHWFAPEVPAADARAWCALRKPYAEACLTALRRFPGVAATRLAGELDISRKVAARLLGDLHAAGLIQFTARGPEVVEERVPTT